MAEVDVKAVASATGTFAVLRPQQVQGTAERGKPAPETGKTLPAMAEKGRDLDMQELARKLNVATQSIGRDLRFEVDMESGRSVIQVLDRETGEIIRQIPPEKASQFMNADGDVQLRLYDQRV